MVMLGFTAVIAGVWSHFKLFSQDVMYEFQTDSVDSLRQLVHVQRTSPISLDPLLYHALSHASMQVFGATAFAQRLPSLLGFLLMQVCLFFLVRRLQGERAAAVAATFPALSATLYYAVEGRPYGLLLGFCALAMLCWVRAASDSQQSRTLPLVGLAFALAAMLNTHYFAVLLLIPFAAAELWRTISRRRLDIPMLTALVAGVAGIVFTRPFMKAAGAFRTHYYNQGSVGLRDITRAYRSLIVDYTTMPIALQRISAAVLVVLALALIAACWRHWQRGDSRLNPALWVLLVTLAGLPFAGYLLARFVTHSIEVRYVLGALIAISALLAISLARRLESDRVFSAVMIVMGIALLASGAVRIRSQKRDSEARLASLVLPEAALRFLLQHPDRRFYIQDMGAFEEDRYYIPDPGLKERIALMYSSDEELRWNQHDTMALTAMHLQQFTTLPVEAYEQARARDGEQLFLLRHTGWDWTDQALAADHAEVQVIGHAFDGDLALVRFH